MTFDTPRQLTSSVAAYTPRWFRNSLDTAPSPSHWIRTATSLPPSTLRSRVTCRSYSVEESCLGARLASRAGFADELAGCLSQRRTRGFDGGFCRPVPHVARRYPASRRGH